MVRTSIPRPTGCAAPATTLCHDRHTLGDRHRLLVVPSRISRLIATIPATSNSHRRYHTVTIPLPYRYHTVTIPLPFFPLTTLTACVSDRPHTILQRPHTILPPPHTVIPPPPRASLGALPLRPCPGRTSGERSRLPRLLPLLQRPPGRGAHHRGGACVWRLRDGYMLDACQIHAGWLVGTRWGERGCYLLLLTHFLTRA